MDISGDASVRAALERSNIEPSHRDSQRSVVAEVLAKANLVPSDVLAVSQAEVSLKPDGSSMGTRPMLVVVVRPGIALAEHKGLRTRRIDVQAVSYQSISAVLHDEKFYDPRRGEMAIQGVAGGSVPLFRIGWNWSQSGPVTAAQAAAERDRILDVIQRAMRGERTASRPDADSGQATAPFPSQQAHLVNWVTGLFREAGLPPVSEHVENVARTAATGLFVSRVVAYADSRPLPSLQQYCRTLPGDLADRFDQFDDIYATWIRLVTEEDARTDDQSSPEFLRVRGQHQELVDHAIDKCLDDSRESFLDGIRQDYGQPASPTASGAEQPAPAAAGPEPSSGSAWNAVKGRARQAREHINPLVVQHGIESVQGALTGAGIAKVDKNSGKIKIRKTGVARAAIQPTRALRRAAEGAAITDHLRAYNDSRAARGQAGPAPETGRPTAASSPEEFASYDSKRDYLRDWARRLIVAAGVAPREQLVLDYANRAATAITDTVLAPLATSASPDLSAPGAPQGTSLDSFDALYLQAAGRAGGQQTVDQGVVALLDSRHDSWMQEIRQLCQ